MPPPWDVLWDDDCARWFDGLSDDVQDAIAAVIGVLQVKGPLLGRPLADTLQGAPIANLKELRVQHKGQPWRLLYVFDPKRRAVILVGGNKAGDSRWYEVNIPIAVARAKRHGVG